jgi:endoglucanase
VIRAQDPDSVVLVGTRGWSSLGVSEGSDEREIVANPVNARNIMYTFHFYAASHREEYLSTLSRAAQRLPLFVTEFGTQNYAGEGSNDFARTQRYLDLLKSKKISWVNWNFSDDWRSGAVFKEGTCGAGSWTGTAPLKEAGCGSVTSCGPLPSRAADGLRGGLLARPGVSCRERRITTYTVSVWTTRNTPYRTRRSPATQC